MTPLASAGIPLDDLSVHDDVRSPVRPVAVAEGEGHHPRPDPLDYPELDDHGALPAITEVPESLGVRGRNLRSAAPGCRAAPGYTWRGPETAYRSSRSWS